MGKSSTSGCTPSSGSDWLLLKLRDHVRRDGMHQFPEATDVSRVEGQHDVLCACVLECSDAGDHPRWVIPRET